MAEVKITERRGGSTETGLTVKVDGKIVLDGMWPVASASQEAEYFKILAKGLGARVIHERQTVEFIP